MSYNQTMCGNKLDQQGELFEVSVVYSGYTFTDVKVVMNTTMIGFTV